jgi:2-dehydropantoate 2-reductase
MTQMSTSQTSTPRGDGAPLLIIGPGAVGTVIGARAAAAGWTPSFLGRDGPRAVAATIELPDGASLALHSPAAAASPPSLVLVPVKAFDLAAALAALPPLPPGTPVVPLANGAVEDVVRAAAARRPELAWRLGYCDFGVSVLAPGRLAVRSRKGAVHWGSLSMDGATDAERALVDGGGGFFVWHGDVLRLQRRKWLYNTVINSLAAERRLARNGDLLADLPMLAAVFDEALRLSEATWGDWAGVPRDALWKGLLELVEATSANENSMARDMREGRRTESGFLAGRACDARAYPLLTGLHRALEE